MDRPQRQKASRGVKTVDRLKKLGNRSITFGLLGTYRFKGIAQDMSFDMGNGAVEGAATESPKPFYKEHRIRFPDGDVSFPLINAYTFVWFLRYRFRKYNWHEPSLTQLILDLSKEKSVFIDVGAHLGYFSILFSRYAGNESYAIELDPKNYSLLEKMVQSAWGVRGQIEPLNLGISDHEFTAAMPVRGASPVSSLQRMEKTQGETRQVRVTSLDTFCDERGISPDVIKVDVEGFEWEFLKGCSETLTRFKPVLIMEVHSDKLEEKGVTEEDVVRVLRDFGYRIYWFANHRSRVPGALEPFGNSGGQRNFNIICKPNA